MGRTIYTCFVYGNRKYNVNSFIGQSVVLDYVTVHRVEQIWIAKNSSESKLDAMTSWICKLICAVTCRHKSYKVLWETLADHSVDYYGSNLVLSSCPHFFVCWHSPHHSPPIEQIRINKKSRIICDWSWYAQNMQPFIFITFIRSHLVGISFYLFWSSSFDLLLRTAQFGKLCDVYINMTLGRLLVHVVLPNAHYKQLKSRADAEMN